MSIKSIKLMNTASGTSIPARIRRLAPLVALPACMAIGVLFAFAVVVAWFPKGYEAWNYPLHQIDAPAHYYFIRRILDQGIGAATHLWPNDAYYPPLFHLLAAGLISIARLFGAQMNIYTAFNVVWIAGAGLVWPAGMQLLASYWTCRGLRDARAGAGSRGTPSAPSETSDSSDSSGASADSPLAPSRLFPCAMALIVPLLSVASASHPFQMLASGPLVAYGLAFSLLPFWLYCTLRWFDAIVIGLAAGHDWREAAGKVILRWGVLTVLTGGITVFAHPRMTFTWLLFIGPFLLLRLPWRFILAALAACVVGAIVLFAYMVTHYKSDRYLNPGDWFHTFVPNRTVPDALRVFVTDNIDGPAGVVMAVMVVAAIAVTIAVATCAVWGIPRRQVVDRINAHPEHSLRKDAVSVLLVVFLFALLYVCSTALTGWFPNIVAAVWYRAETRPLTMIPLAIVVLLIFAASALHGTAIPSPRAPSTRRTISAIMVAVLAALAVGAQFGGVERAVDGRLVGWGNSTRAVLAENVHANMVLNDSQPDEQLTRTKYDILADVARTVEPGAAVISDPLNGSMYGKTVFDVNMLYPIYNPMAEKNGAIFGAVERAFDSGDKTTVLNTVCPIEQDKPEYFLVMGGQAPSLEMFTFRQQYDPFHRDDLIARYTADGTLVKVRDYSDRADYAKGWALYRFGCAR
ncbi:hypothetical protein CSQ85_07805 [Bifidobacterium rousetti]|uniref:DUF6541 family protein n=1 Tax=Bifidobacterium rousetti TaxID=2045439 RepID=UPI0012395A04|nr:DUF6541 family protein [Bifidobacterium rousetti]KAA8818761.1 hypothetical protein CSQ85_07805 [Bifidobacterium rousetti]